ncbi:unnamed protein product [Cuscuta epithymum]|uniref:Methyltransferase n=1 Tax=Cuscuta epithymum TaxID=186058 RepID=A0AAV0GGW6_9ASTE|nr:unnamed protein product [Cuscuta epithymum]
MALGKVRTTGGRRTSNSSCSSTVTPIAFVALCILGVWLLSSTSVVPPRTTTRESVTTATNAAAGVASSLLSSVTNTISKSPPAFEDHPGELPEDAIKSTDHDNEEAKPGDNNEDASKNESSDRESENQNSNKDQAAVEQSEADRDGGGGESDSKKAAEEAEEEKAEKQSGSEQTDEKGDVSREEIFEAKKSSKEESNDKVQGTSSADTKNLISDEDQQKRFEQQQKEDDQMQSKGQSSEQEAHTEDHQEEVVGEDQTQQNQDTDNAVQKTSKKEWSTQAAQSDNQKERAKTMATSSAEDDDQENSTTGWKLCNVTAGPDYIPCLDNEEAIRKLRSRRHFEHRERHCPEEPPTCLVPLPKGYKKPIEWPQSRDKIWYHNVPHTLLAEVKGHQNWMKVSGEFLTFPGGGTQFIHGALHYIDFVQQAVPKIAWGKRTRVILDVGCGVASFGGYLFDRDVLAMSFAPKDEHEAQIQFALERGIPAISAVMGSQRLPFPSGVFDIVHCARCRVPWHAEGGALLLELNRVLRPGGYFVWSATPVYQTLKEDVQIWKEMSTLTVSMCWKLVGIKKDKLNSIGVAIYHKPENNVCYNHRKSKTPPMCDDDDDPNAAWYVPLQACMHRISTDEKDRGSKWPKQWPERLQTPPYWLNRSQMGIYGKPAPDDFAADYEHWKHVISKSYMSGLGINWSSVRNIMDMRAVYGGFAAALKDLKVWVMNVVNVDSPDTLPIIYERGLFGIYHDWCESFSTYPRTYDLLHADHLFSKLKLRCKISAVMAEVDRIVRPGGKFIMQDDSGTIKEVENILKSLHWEVRMTFYQKQDGMLSAEKTEWRPEAYAASST